MFAIVYWEDCTFTVISLTGIVSPRKDFSEYNVGEKIRAKYKGKEYGAIIYEFGGLFWFSYACLTVDVNYRAYVPSSNMF